MPAVTLDGPPCDERALPDDDPELNRVTGLEGVAKETPPRVADARREWPVEDVGTDAETLIDEERVGGRLPNSEVGGEGGSATRSSAGPLSPFEMERGGEDDEDDAGGEGHPQRAPLLNSVVAAAVTGD
jgi:hypothetical protein